MDHAKGGDYKRNNYICGEVNEDILIFGSSRAIHHYNPVIISDSLDMSCYNCGQDGNGAILNYGRYQLINQRHHPKILIYDVASGFDLLAGEDNHKYLKWLKAYYRREGIPEIFESVDDTEKYKMVSQLYRYNSNCIQILTEYLHPMQNDGIKGFRPNNGEMNTMKISRRDSTKKKEYVYDSLKLSYLKRMINESEDTKIVFAVSPCWDGADTTSFQPIKELCEEYELPFIDFSNSPKYVHHNEYFKDGTHLNARGADEFTRDFIRELRMREVTK